jgi:S-adenosylmethionine/arginine decarboxylase-like enzyme
MWLVLLQAADLLFLEPFAVSMLAMMMMSMLAIYTYPILQTTRLAMAHCSQRQTGSDSVRHIVRAVVVVPLASFLS